MSTTALPVSFISCVDNLGAYRIPTETSLLIGTKVYKTYFQATRGSPTMCIDVQMRLVLLALTRITA
jgi:hypothetical protein